METVLVSQSNIDIISELLLSNNIVAFPTETVFGLGVLRESDSAFEKLFEVKKRDLTKAITLMVGSKERITELCIISDYAKRVIDVFMPGELTIVLPLKKEMVTGSLKLNYIGIRIPNDEFVLDLLANTGDMWVTSANLSGCDNLYNFNEVFDVFDGSISAVVSKNAGGNLASSVIKIVDDNIDFLRIGNISENQIKEILV